MPVNASLFTSLFNATDDIVTGTDAPIHSTDSIHNTTSVVSYGSVLHICISRPECIGCIGEEAYDEILYRAEQ